MDVEDLNFDQRKALAVFAFQMMVADHSVALPEEIRVDWLESELGVAGKIDAGDYFVEPSLALFSDPCSRLLLMGELFVVALADGKRHPNEHALLKRLAAEFGYSWKAMADLLVWATLPAGDRPSVHSLKLA